MAADHPSSKNSFRPAPRVILGNWEHLIAFGFGAGLSPVAPGTAGTLVALPLWWLLRPLPLLPYLALLALLFGFGCWVCGLSARRLGVHDFGGIVFDEIVGLFITCLPLLPALGLVGSGRPAMFGWTLAAFLLFRLFDVWKPWPIRVLDRRVGGGFGIMLDDLVAALYAAAILALSACWLQGLWRASG